MPKPYAAQLLSTYLSGIINQAIDDTGWTAIDMPAVSCKQILINEAGGDPFNLSLVSGGSPAILITEQFGIRMRKTSAQTLFYARMPTGTGTVQILLVD